MGQTRSGAKRAGEKGQGVVIARVLAEVQRALQNAQSRTAASGFPKLETATITLQTVIAQAGGGVFKFLVFSFGRTWEKERSHEMVLTLKPVKAGLKSVRSLADDLADAIVDAAEGVRDALIGNPPLSLDAFKVTIAFVVTEGASAGADFTIAPITFELKGNLKTKALHKIELSFKR